MNDIGLFINLNLLIKSNAVEDNKYFLFSVDTFNKIKIAF